MAEECVPCLVKTRERMAKFSMASGVCSMLGTSEEREECQKSVQSMTEDQLDDDQEMARFFAEMIRKGGVQLFKKFFDNLNRVQAKCFIAGTELLMADGEVVTPSVQATYDFYREQLAKMIQPEGKEVLA